MRKRPYELWTYSHASCEAKTRRVHEGILEFAHRFLLLFISRFGFPWDSFFLCGGMFRSEKR